MISKVPAPLKFHDACDSCFLMCGTRLNPLPQFLQCVLKCIVYRTRVFSVGPEFVWSCCACLSCSLIPFFLVRRDNIFPPSPNILTSCCRLIQSGKQVIFVLNAKIVCLIIFLGVNLSVFSSQACRGQSSPQPEVVRFIRGNGWRVRAEEPALDSWDVRKMTEMINRALNPKLGAKEGWRPPGQTEALLLEATSWSERILEDRRGHGRGSLELQIRELGNLLQIPSVPAVEQE